METVKKIFGKIGRFLKKHIKLVIVLVIVLAIVFYVRHSMSKAKQLMEEQANKPVTSTIEQMDLQKSVSVTGTLNAVDSAKVTSTIGGTATGDVPDDGLSGDLHIGISGYRGTCLSACSLDGPYVGRTCEIKMGGFRRGLSASSDDHRGFSDELLFVYSGAIHQEFVILMVQDVVDVCIGVRGDTGHVQIDVARIDVDA